MSFTLALDTVSAEAERLQQELDSLLMRLEDMKHGKIPKKKRAKKEKEADWSSPELDQFYSEFRVTENP